MKLVFDAGASQTRIARVQDGKIDGVQHFDTVKNASGIKEMADRLLDLAAGEPVEAIAGGLPGIVRDGKLREARNLPDWQTADIVTTIKQIIDAQILIHNDTVGVGLGEMWHGAGSKSGKAAYVTVSTGVNAVRYVDGQADSSISPFELGRQIVSGGVHHANDIESLIGGAAVQTRFGAHPRSINQPAFWRQEAVYLARMLYNLRLYWSVDRVVLGGSMMRDIDIDLVAKEVERLPQVWESQLEIVPAKLGSDGGLYGAMVRLETA